MQYGNQTHRCNLLPASVFKSYYVVWKHICEFLHNIFHHSLNRTMQYGNKNSPRRGRHKNKGLNRTMQYGNYLVTAILFVLFYCLNRTMQYGNHNTISFKSRLFTCLNRTMQYGNFFLRGFRLLRALFKSYYVVWKPFMTTQYFQL